MDRVPTTAATEPPLRALKRLTVSACAGATLGLKELVWATRPALELVG